MCVTKQAHIPGWSTKPQIYHPKKKVTLLNSNFWTKLKSI